MKVLITLLFLLSSTLGVAETYDLDQILNLADQNNNEIKLAKAELRTAAARKMEAWSTALPKLNIDLSYNRNFMDTFFYISVTDSAGNKSTNRFSVSFANEYQANAVLNQTLFSFGRIGSALLAAKYYDRLTDAQYQRTLDEVLIRVKKAFFQSLLLERVWKVAIESESSAKDNYENIKIRYESGAVSEFDLLQAETRWQNTIPQSIRAHQNYLLALNNLKALVQIPLDENITLDGDLESIPARPDSLAIHKVLENRPDYNALLWQKELQKKNVKIQFSNHLPTLSGQAVYSYAARSDQYSLENDNDNFIVRLNLNIPIFNGLYTRAQVQRAKIDVDKVQTRIDLTLDTIEIQMQNIYLRLDETRQQVNASQKSKNIARRAFEIADTRVRNGLATQLELKDSRLQLDQANLNYYSAIYDYLDAYFDWQLATSHVSASGI